MKKETEKIEIPFGAKDSELYKFEYTIPDGYEAEIKDGKVIVKKKESEDERIRKSLVKYFRKFKPKDMWDEMFSFGDVLFYLEKQKDKRGLDFAEGKVEGVKQTCQEIKDAMSLFEPKDLTAFELTFRDYIDSAIRYCLSGEGYQQYIKEWAADLLNIEKKKEQKPAEWNDVDMKEVRENLISVCRDWERGKKTTLLPVVAVRARYFLEHFVEPKQPESSNSEKPNDHAEWSEDDWKLLDEMRNYLMSMCHSRDLSPNHIYEGFIDLIDRLKSLRPQPHWKPSEYMLSLVKKVANGEMLTRMELMAMETLCNDLQKLL